MTYCLPFYPHGQWDGILCSPARGLGLGSLQSSAQLQCHSERLLPRSYRKVSQSKQECPGTPWPRWDGSSRGKLLVTGDQGLFQAWRWHGLTMAWDESLGMERQSSDKMVAQGSGVAAIALEPLPPTALTLQCATGTPGVGTALCSCPWRASL